MTVLDFQDALADEVRRVLKDIYLPDPMNTAETQVMHCMADRVFTQYTPLPLDKERGGPREPIPYESLAEANAYKPPRHLARPPEKWKSLQIPHAIVRVYEGVLPEEDDNEPWTVPAIIHFGVFDDGPMRQGYRDVMIMNQRILNRFQAEPLLAGFYMAQRKEQKFYLQDNESYPFYFGGVIIRFNVPSMDRREPVNGIQNEGPHVAGDAAPEDLCWPNAGSLGLG